MRPDHPPASTWARSATTSAPFRGGEALPPRHPLRSQLRARVLRSRQCARRATASARRDRSVPAGDRSRAQLCRCALQPGAGVRTDQRTPPCAAPLAPSTSNSTRGTVGPSRPASVEKNHVPGKADDCPPHPVAQARGEVQAHLKRTRPPKIGGPALKRFALLLCSRLASARSAIHPLLLIQGPR